MLALEGHQDPIAPLLHNSEPSVTELTAPLVHNSEQGLNGTAKNLLQSSSITILARYI